MAGDCLTGKCVLLLNAVSARNVTNMGALECLSLEDLHWWNMAKAI